MFLFADLLCCSAVFPIFYGIFKEDIDENKESIRDLENKVFKR